MKFKEFPRETNVIWGRFSINDFFALFDFGGYPSDEQAQKNEQRLRV
ncbi:hypothetical protein thalar_01117 [Litoreibacter arenae DSM 19593]|uniref:Uncharacterized protein n=1 Tax=Litoreibacter arenae DSM 19593 TaxID=1123360 RepID=S9RS50_9RHOB|nr:hypothetical protein thalar_01117 [Litoreibacter arenae DSM 19593]